MNCLTTPPLNVLPSSSRRFLQELLRLQALSADTAEVFLQEPRDRLLVLDTPERLGQALFLVGLGTRYQLERVQGGRTHGLVLGNYRVLEVLASGGMGQVYLGEHCLMRRRVAVKVLRADEETPPALRQRF